MAVVTEVLKKYCYSCESVNGMLLLTW